MLEDQVSIVGSLLLLDPAVDALKDPVSFQVEVCQHDLLELRGRRLYHRVHSVGNVPVFDDVLVRVVERPVVLSVQVLVARLVVEHILVHNYRLNAQQHLTYVGVVGLPVLFRLPCPSSEQGQTDITRLVQVRIESDTAAPGGLQVDFRRTAWIRVFEYDRVQEGPMLVRGS